MTTPVYRLQRELAYAQARQAYYQAFTPSETLGPARPMDTYAYYSLLLKEGASQAVFKLQASRPSVTFFSDALLGISKASEELTSARNKPRSLKPSKVKAMIGRTDRVKETAFGGTGRKYVKYAKDATGDAQAHYSAPFSKKSASVTYADLDTMLTALVAAKANDLGNYGRIYLVTERYSESS